jgi:hypothetical protein
MIRVGTVPGPRGLMKSGSCSYAAVREAASRWPPFLRRHCGTSSWSSVDVLLQGLGLDIGHDYIRVSLAPDPSATPEELRFDADMSQSAHVASLALSAVSLLSSAESPEPDRAVMSRTRSCRATRSRVRTVGS